MESESQAYAWLQVLPLEPGGAMSGGVRPLPVGPPGGEESWARGGKRVPGHRVSHLDVGGILRERVSRIEPPPP